KPVRLYRAHAVSRVNEPGRRSPFGRGPTGGFPSTTEGRKRMKRLMWRALVSGALLAAAVATGPASADPAPAPHSTLGRPTAGPAASPDVLGSGNLVNHGGHVESTATNYLIF